MQLTPAQLQQFKDEGYTVVRGLIPRADVAAVRARSLEHLDGKHELPLRNLQVRDPAKFRAPNGGFVPASVQEPASLEEVFQRMADHPNLQSAMAQLLGGPVKRFTDQTILKHKDIDGQSFYHQDSYYWHLKPELGCNSWIALDDVGKDAIALGILPGSHKPWTLTPHEQYFDDPSLHGAIDGKAFKRFRIPIDQIDFSKEVLLPMAPGDAAFFTNYTWHRAEPNNSGRHLFAYGIAYQRADAA